MAIIPDSKVARPTPITDDVFKVSLYLKAADGVLECLGGILLLILSPERLNKLAQLVTQHELSTDPNDFIASHILKTGHNLSSGTLIFGALYLLSHGIVKVFLVVQVLRNRLWAYLALIAVTAGFIIYQLYRLTQKPSVGLVALTLFDILIIYLTQKEYRQRLASLPPTATGA